MLYGRPESVSYMKLHSLLLNHKFIQDCSLWQLSISLPTSEPIQFPAANFNQQSIQNFDRNQHNNSYRGHGQTSRGRGGRIGRANHLQAADIFQQHLAVRRQAALPVLQWFKSLCA